jgi:serine protease
MRQLILFLSLSFVIVGCGTPPTPSNPCVSACLELEVETATTASFPAQHLSAPRTLSSLAALEPAQLLMQADEGNVAALGAVDGGVASGERDALSKLLNLGQVWNVTQGEGITVAVIDSGVDAQHEALRGQVLPGYDFLNNSADTSDLSGHGTAVAALIAGNGTFKGFAPKARILPLRVLGESNFGSNQNVAKAVLYAVNLLPELPNPYPAQVINLSLGRYADSPVLREAVRRAREAGAIIVAGAGNNGQEGLAYPAAFPEVISVGAAHVINDTWNRQAYSSYGKELDLIVPAGGLTNTNQGRYAATSVVSAEAGSEDGLALFSGTSVAAPQVSGLAALLLALEPDARKVESILLGSSSDVNTRGWDSETGYGLINPVASVRAALAQQPTGPVSVRLLDAGSKQEAYYQTGLNLQRSELEPGNYTLFVWQDQNADGLWQQDEPCAERSEPLALTTGSSQKVQLSLSACTERE